MVPLRVDVPMWRRPYMNYAIMLLTITVSIAAWSDDILFNRLAGDGGFTANSFRYAITSALLHVDPFHLLGNMLFLWIFGNAVNYKFGHLPFLGIYLLAALAGGIAHDAIDGRIAVGASAAVSGVMAAFLIYFPRNDITVLWIIWIKPGISSLSSAWVILYNVCWDIYGIATGGGGGVAVWAHIFGFLPILLIAFACAWYGWINPTQDEQTLLQVFNWNRKEPDEPASQRRYAASDYNRIR